MFGDKKEISAGDGSTNLQAQSIIINSGISYSEAREIALQTFRDNAYKLSEVAQKTAIERAELLINRFLEKMQRESPELIHKIVDPDIQYSVINGQKQFARSGRPETLELLTDLMKKRFQAEDHSLSAIVLNEAIEVMAKVTSNHLLLITSLFLSKNYRQPSVRDFINNQYKVMNNNFKVYTNGRSYFEHLVYTGVIRTDDTNDSSQKFEHFIRRNYKEEVHEYVEKGTTDLLYPPIRAQFITDDISSSVFETWNASLISRYMLTSVGLALAVSFFNIISDIKLDFRIWINGN